MGDLELRDLVKIRFLPASMTALRIKAQSPEPVTIKGVISGLALTAVAEFPKVTVYTPGVGLHTFSVTRTTAITKDNRQATFRDLQVGDSGVFVFDPVSSNASRISVRSPEYVAVSGIIQSIDTTTKPVTIVVSTPGALGRLSLHVGESTQIEKDNHENASIRDLAQGDLVVRALYNPNTFNVLKLVITSPPASRVQLEGVLSTIEGVIWTIGESQVHLSRGTHIIGKPMIGATLEVVAFERADGTFLALMIVVE